MCLVPTVGFEDFGFSQVPVPSRPAVSSRRSYGKWLIPETGLSERPFLHVVPGVQMDMRGTPGEQPPVWGSPGLWQLAL